MDALRRLLPVLLAMVVVAGCLGGESEALTDPSAMELLSQPLWIERDAYDASHSLMVPMHAAFAQGRRWEIERYASFFSSFRTTGTASFVPDRFHRLQFLYFYSRFITLLAERENCSRRSLDHHAAALSLWAPIVLAPAWQWDRADFPTLFDRVRWKLDQQEVAYSYYRAITDEDLYGLAVGADLAAVASRCTLEQTPQYSDSLALARAIFSHEVTPTAVGGWVLQKGAWTDHPDYAYAGHELVAPDLQSAPVPGISPDSSHSFRLPLLLVSFACAEPPGSSSRAFFARLTDQLAIQWWIRTVVMPDYFFNGVRMTNYMDGENGVYRYGYPTQGAGRGFGPYELSGSLNIGWWSFVGPLAAPVYQAQLASLPFGDEELAIYVGPNTTRTRNPAFTEPDFYKDTLIREVLDSAVHVASRTNWCR
jgi:hypothetical protein